MEEKKSVIINDRRAVGTSGEEKAAGPLSTEASDANAKAALESGAQQAEEQTGPKVSAQIVITLHDDGNVKVDGPFNDRIMFAGMLYIAAEIERNMYAESMRKAAAENARRIEVIKQGGRGFFERFRRRH